MKLSRRKWLGRSLFYGSGFAGFGYGSLVEKRWLDVTRQHIPLTESHAALEGLKIAVMGDFHHDDFGDEELIGRAVKVINDEQVDLVYLVGDYISRDAAAIVPLCEVLRDLRPTLGTFAVMGNHDAWHVDPILFKSLENAGVRMLINNAQEFDHFGVVGMDSFWGGRPDLPFALNKITAGKPVILGWHEPDTFAAYDDPCIVLQVSGHTHGGQICAPFYGPILLPEHGQKYPYGYYRRGDSSLFVTRGVGTLTLPARFLCPPEVVLLKFGVA